MTEPLARGHEAAGSRHVRVKGTFVRRCRFPHWFAVCELLIGNLNSCCKFWLFAVSIVLFLFPSSAQSLIPWWSLWLVPQSSLELQHPTTHLLVLVSGLPARYRQICRSVLTDFIHFAFHLQLLRLDLERFKFNVKASTSQQTNHTSIGPQRVKHCDLSRQVVTFTSATSRYHFRGIPACTPLSHWPRLIKRSCLRGVNFPLLSLLLLLHFLLPPGCPLTWKSCFTVTAPSLCHCTAGGNLRVAAAPGLQRRRDRMPADPAAGQRRLGQWQCRERYAHTAHSWHRAVTRVDELCVCQVGLLQHLINLSLPSCHTRLYVVWLSAALCCRGGVCQAAD